MLGVEGGVGCFPIYCQLFSYVYYIDFVICMKLRTILFSALKKGTVSTDETL